MDSVYEQAIGELENAGAWRCSPSESDRIRQTLWQNGKLNRKVIGKDAAVLVDIFELSAEARDCDFFIVEQSEVEGEHSFADEKLSLVLTVYRASDWAEAKRIVHQVLDVRGKGHSVGIHTKNTDHVSDLAATTDVVRVLVNQAHALSNGGSFENALPFTLSMGGGTWAGNSIDENLNWRHFVNLTYLVTTIPEDRPSEDELFGDYWERYGK